MNVTEGWEYLAEFTNSLLERQKVRQRFEDYRRIVRAELTKNPVNYKRISKLEDEFSDVRALQREFNADWETAGGKSLLELSDFTEYEQYIQQRIDTLDVYVALDDGIYIKRDFMYPEYPRQHVSYKTKD